MQSPAPFPRMPTSPPSFTYVSPFSSAIRSCGSSAERSRSSASSSCLYRALLSIVIFESRATTSRSEVTISGLTSIRVASSAIATSCSFSSRSRRRRPLASSSMWASIASCPAASAVKLLAGLDVTPDEGRGIGLGDLLDVHAAHSRQHRQELLLGSVENHRRVVLGVDLRRRLDPDLVDREPPDVHPEDGLGVLQRLVAIVGDLDPARLAALADPHLRLDHARIADLLGGLDRGGNGVRVPARRDGHAVLREQLLALVLEQVHQRGAVKPFRIGAAQPIRRDASRLRAPAHESARTGEMWRLP